MSARNGYWVEKDGGTHATCVRWKDLFVHPPAKKKLRWGYVRAQREMHVASPGKKDLAFLPLILPGP